MTSSERTIGLALALALAWAWPGSIEAQEGEAEAPAEAEGEAGGDAASEAGEDAGGEAAEEAEGATEDGAEGEGADPALEEARTRFRRGVELARAGNCRGALAELQASLEIVERPNTLYNIARCQEEMHRYDLAVEAYERYQAVAPADAPDRAAVEATMRSLRNLLGTIVVESNVPATVWIGDRLVGEAPGEVLVPGGRHALEVRARGHLAERREVEVAGQRTVRVEVELERAEMNVTNVEQRTVNVTEEGGAPPAVFYTGVVLTGAAAVATAVLGVRALGLRADADDIDPLDRTGRLDGAEEADQAALLTDVLLGVTGALAIATLVLYFVTDWDDDESEERASLSLRVSPRAVVLEGRF